LQQQYTIVKQLVNSAFGDNAEYSTHLVLSSYTQYLRRLL
jgi:hypothetical protein